MALCIGKCEDEEKIYKTTTDRHEPSRGLSETLFADEGLATLGGTYSRTYEHKPRASLQKYGRPGHSSAGEHRRHVQHTALYHRAEFHTDRLQRHRDIIICPRTKKRDSRQYTQAIVIIIITRGQSNLTKSASRGAHSPVRGHPRGSKVVPLNSWGRVSY